jgi:hypothetical protein
MRFNRNSALFFQVHIVEQLILHITLGNRVCELNKPVRKRTFPVVDVSDYRKISN